MVGGQREDGGGPLLRPLRVQLLRLQGEPSFGAALRDCRGLNVLARNLRCAPNEGRAALPRAWRPERGKWPRTPCDRETASSSSSPGELRERLSSELSVN